MTDESIRVRDSLFAEILLSLMMGGTLLACLMIIKGFNEYIDVSNPAQVLPLLLVIIHTLIRRRWPLLIPCFLLHTASSVLFFIIMVIIPATGFGNGVFNMIYLGVIVTVLTLYSVKYRLKPTYMAGDPHVIAFPASILPLFGVFYINMLRKEIFRMFVFYVFMVAVIYLFMRQLAIFETKYYHAIQRSSRPVRHLKKQNYMTAVGLVVIFAISILVLQLVPFETLTEAIKGLLIAILPALIKALLAFINFLGTILFADDRTRVPQDNMLITPEDGSDDLIFNIIAAVLAVVLLIGMILTIINAIRLLIQNAPRYDKDRSSGGNDSIVDTIESIRPEKKVIITGGHDFGTGRERQIRKQFYIKTRRAMAKGLPVTPASTPGQIETALLANGDSEISELRPEYEKVRYGKKE